MEISGLQKLTLLDFPGRTACTVFLGGCDLRCPFCHNGELLEGRWEPVMSREELLAFLEKRRGLLDGVCVSGGEPTLHPDLPALLREIRGLGFAVKLDTNGGRPAVLSSLVEEGLVDYVAMDVKNSPERYAETAGMPELDPSAIFESLSFLLEGRVEYELRTTVVEQFHDEESFRGIGELLETLAPGKKARRYFLQNFVDRETVIRAGLCAPRAEDLERYARILSPYVEQIGIRGL